MCRPNPFYLFYQCVLYGGRLLSHFTAKEPDEESKDWIEIFRVNRNAILLMDSDKESESHEINSTKQRLLDEINTSGGYGWVTKGREVENYIPSEVITKLYPGSGNPHLGEFEDFFDFLEKIKEGDGKCYSGKKPLLAEKICPLLTKDSIRITLDLEEKLNKACGLIKSWNGFK